MLSSSAANQPTIPTYQTKHPSQPTNENHINQSVLEVRQDKILKKATKKNKKGYTIDKVIVEAILVWSLQAFIAWRWWWRSSSFNSISSSTATTLMFSSFSVRMSISLSVCPVRILKHPSYGYGYGITMPVHLIYLANMQSAYINMYTSYTRVCMENYLHVNTKHFNLVSLCEWWCFLLSLI